MEGGLVAYLLLKINMLRKLQTRNKQDQVYNIDSILFS